MTDRTRRAIIWSILASILVVGCVGTAASPTPAATSVASEAASVAAVDATPAAASPSPTVALSPSTSPVPSASSDCGSQPPDLATIVALDPSARLACFRGSELTFQATVAKAISDCGIGPRVTPTWFCLPGVFLGPPAPASDAGPLDVYWDPASGITPATFHSGATVRITGHFDDPAAASCHVTSVPAGQSPPPPDAVVLSCRETFVVTGVK